MKHLFGKPMLRELVDQHQ